MANHTEAVTKDRQTTSASRRQGDLQARNAGQTLSIIKHTNYGKKRPA